MTATLTGPDDTPEAADPQPGCTAEFTIAELEAQIVALARDVAAAESRWLQMVEEFDRRRGWATTGMASCAHWLAWRCGLTLHAAREKVRVARALRLLPQIREACESGELSYARARAVTRVATPDNETFFMDLARRTTGAELERALRTASGGTRAASARALRAARHFHHHWEADGSLVVHARLGAEEGAALLAALEAAQAGSAVQTAATAHSVDETRVGTRDSDRGAEPRHGPDDSAPLEVDALLTLAQTYMAATSAPAPKARPWFKYRASARTKNGNGTAHLASDPLGAGRDAPEGRRRLGRPASAEGQRKSSARAQVPRARGELSGRAPAEPPRPQQRSSVRPTGEGDVPQQEPRIE